jgi:hypothetical protein
LLKFGSNQDIIQLGEWINQVWYIQHMEYYLVVSTNELSNRKKYRETSVHIIN